MHESIEESIRQSAIEDNPNFILLSDKAQELLIKQQLWNLGARFLDLTMEELEPLVRKRSKQYNSSVHMELLMFILNRRNHE